ncbi:MAG: hypothetical protein E4H14_12055 [Candidatus Thorarchaeota archaeon]|nr:MAG: hypothetical protein E4H14_12055 [Candidatus Thorarchaeota archaeon]
MSLLGVLFIFGFFMILASGRITYLESSKLPAITTVGSLVLIGIYLVPVDIFTKYLLIVLSLSLFSVLFMNEANKLQIAYPLITGSFFGIVFWQFFLANYDVFLLIIGYVCIETLFLSYVGNLRKYSWCIFAFTLGIVLSIILQPIGLAALLIGFSIGFEVLWRVPEVPELEIIFEKYNIHHGNVQSFLLASIAALLVNQGINNLVVVGESFLLVLLTSLLVANGKTASVQLEYVMSFAVTVTLSALVFEFITMFFLYTSILVVYPSLVIIAIFLFWSSKQEPYRQYNWHLFSAIIAFLLSLEWYIFYGMFESMILIIPTFVTGFFLLELKIPESDWKSKSELIPAMSSSILLAEIIWIWHATIGFMLEPIVVLIGVGIILLSTIFIPAFEAVDWFSFRRPWIIVSTFAALCLTSLFTGWNMLSLQLPSSPLLLLGIGFILYSIFTTPYFIKAEKSIQLEDSQSRYHQQWIPAII